MVVDDGKPVLAVAPRIKLELGMSANATDEDLQFARQMGLEYVQVTGPPAGRPSSGRAAPGTFIPSYDYLARVASASTRAGLKIYNWGNWRNEAIILGLPNRDEVIAGYCGLLRALGRVGIPCTTYAHWSVIPELFRTEAEPIRGGARAAGFDVGKATAVSSPAALRAGVLRARDLGQLRLLRHARRAGGRGRRLRMRCTRRSPLALGSPACPAASSAPSPATSGPWRSRTAPTSGRLPVHRLLAGGGREHGRDGRRGDRRLRRAAQALPRPLPQRERAPAPLRRDLRRRGVHGHVPGDEGPAGWSTGASRRSTPRRWPVSAGSAGLHLRLRQGPGRAGERGGGGAVAARRGGTGAGAGAGAGAGDRQAGPIV